MPIQLFRRMRECLTAANSADAAGAFVNVHRCSDLTSCAVIPRRDLPKHNTRGDQCRLNRSYCHNPRFLLLTNLQLPRLIS